MCSRFVRRVDIAVYADLFGFFSQAQPIPPCYNVACTDLADVVRVEENQATHARVGWGFLPTWAKDAKTRHINAKAETLGELRTFRDAFRTRRCLVLADGVIEFKTAGKAKLPYLFVVDDHAPFAMAGIWNRTVLAGQTVESFAVVTTEPNALFQSFPHDRMPVILPREAHAAWLDGDASLQDLSDLLRPFPAERMRFQAIHPRVNNVRNKSAECLEPPPPADVKTPSFVPLDLFSEEV